MTLYVYMYRDELLDSYLTSYTQITRTTHLLDNLHRTGVTTKRIYPIQYQIPHSSAQHHRRALLIKTVKEWNQLPETSVYLITQDET